MGTPLGLKYIPYTYMDPLCPTAPQVLAGAYHVEVAVCFGKQIQEGFLLRPPWSGDFPVFIWAIV